MIYLKEIDFNYNLLKEDKQLNYLLQKLPLKKLIFTNGTYGHGVRFKNYEY